MRDDSKRFIDNLTELMNDNNLNKLGLSKQISCDNAAIGRWFEGLFLPDIKTLYSLSSYFNCSIDYLLGLADKTQYNSLNKTTFSNRFKSLLVSSKLTAYKVSKICGIQQSTISQWLLHGRRPNTVTLIALSKLFDCTIEYLLGRGD